MTPAAAFIEVTMRARGWSRRRLAERAGVSPNTLARLLDGNAFKPQASTLQKLATALGVSGEGLLSLMSRDARFDADTNPAVTSIALADASLFADWTPAEWDELTSTFGVGGELSEEGVYHAAQQINARRETIRRVMILMETHLAEETREAVNALYQSLVISNAEAETLHATPPVEDALRGVPYDQ